MERWLGAVLAFCTSCGTPVLEASPSGTGSPCPGRSSVEPTRRRSAAFVFFAAPLLLAAGFLSIAALFPAYYRGSHSLASDVPTLWFNVPAIIGWVFAGVLVAIPRSRFVGAGLAAGVTVCFAPAYVGDIGLLVHGQQHAGAGLILDYVGLAVAVVGTCVAVLGVRPSFRAGGAIWALTVGIIGIAFSVGEAMPWTQTQVQSTTGVTFRASGSVNVSSQCCTVLQTHGWDRGAVIALIVLAVCVPVVAACLDPSALQSPP